MPSKLTPLESALRRDRSIVVSGLVAITLVSWAYLAFHAWGMAGTETGEVASEVTASRMGRWTATDFFLQFFMWSVMMVAMMVPSVAPLILVFARRSRKRGGDRVLGSAAILLLGYLCLWTAYSGLATLAQWGLHSAALLSPILTSSSHVVGGLILIAAGLFQVTPLKRACLKNCRSPLSFLVSDWRPGRWGTFAMGLKHGAYCVGCCWALMALLFVAGVMNLLWVAIIAGFVLVEKVLSRGEEIGVAAGAILVAAGILLALV